MRARVGEDVSESGEGCEGEVELAGEERYGGGEGYTAWTEFNRLRIPSLRVSGRGAGDNHGGFSRTAGRRSLQSPHWRRRSGGPPSPQAARCQHPARGRHGGWRWARAHARGARRVLPADGLCHPTWRRAAFFFCWQPINARGGPRAGPRAHPVKVAHRAPCITHGLRKQYGLDPTTCRNVSG